MLTSTFVHAPGVGPATEQMLWSQGAIDWKSYQDRAQELRLPARHREALETTVADSIAALEEARIDYFAHNLAKKEHWRAVSEFSKIGYLDIETDGGFGPDSITVIGLYDGFETHTYLKDKNLAQFAFECQDYDGFVTFFGTGFDIPFLKRRFPVLESVFADRFHVDLCPLLKRLGHRGGLKSIEKQLGIARVEEADGLSGTDAIRLWREYRRGGRHSEEALRLLLSYNQEDVVNMKFLLDYALPRMRADSGFPSEIVTA
ncbi:hypothetical protein CCAX7_007330 [Capsulimonas corticalis]|uniref:Uncharacterized protein n=1 Tax=Capsulimonas corticalis TaxID=2219043 RepID=A0A402D1L7_9BACT|nr:ribonuclease H-like domain-containing protein [Capsulimonas corticalis]BDI28682.1 hypothetical protein CCAX7_007330 [Capsulimonas corticalis]